MYPWSEDHLVIEPEPRSLKITDFVDELAECCLHGYASMSLSMRLKETQTSLMGKDTPRSIMEPAAGGKGYFIVTGESTGLDNIWLAALGPGSCVNLRTQ